MKKLIFGLLSVITMGFTVTSCSKQDEAIGIAQEEAIAPPSQIVDADEAKQVITAAQLSGLYELKFESTVANREWKPATSVGFEMFPNTFLYYVGKLNFNPSTLKVTLLQGNGNSSLGNYPFKVNGQILTITYGSTASSASLKVCSLEGKWLRLIDVRTKKGWAFYKK